MGFQTKSVQFPLIYALKGDGTLSGRTEFSLFCQHIIAEVVSRFQKVGYMLRQKNGLLLVCFFIRLVLCFMVGNAFRFFH